MSIDMQNTSLFCSCTRKAGLLRPDCTSPGQIILYMVVISLSMYLHIWQQGGTLRDARIINHPGANIRTKGSEASICVRIFAQITTKKGRKTQKKSSVSSGALLDFFHLIRRAPEASS